MVNRVEDGQLKLCFLILCAPYRPWSRLFRNGIANTWVESEIRDGKHFVYRSEGRKLLWPFSKIINRWLQSRIGILTWSPNLKEIFSVRIPDDNLIQSHRFDTWSNMLGKFLDSSKFLLEQFEFDYLIRVNTTTHVNVKLLEMKLKEFEPDYSGARMKSEECASGWAMVFSRQALSDLLQYQFPEDITKGKFEDGVLCKVLDKIGYRFQPLDYSVLDLPFKEDSLSLIRSSVFIRIKDYRRYFRRDSEELVRLWQKLRQT